MYLDFFNLNQEPFTVTPDSDFIYYGENHFEALSQMIYGVQERKGFVVVTGPVGSGKTTLSRAFLHEIGDDTSTALILNSRMNADELLRAIVDDFGLEPPEDPTTKELVDCLNDFLLEEFNDGRNVCVLIDESQNLSPEALENLRLLSNLETEKDKLLQIVLVGQPELNTVLNRRELRQLKQRINVWISLSNLTKEETREYVRHRLEEAGNADIPFAESVFNRLYEETDGNPRSINLIMDRMLLAAYVNDETKLRERHLEEALENLSVASEDENTPPDPRAFEPLNEGEDNSKIWEFFLSSKSLLNLGGILLVVAVFGWGLFGGVVPDLEFSDGSSTNASEQSQQKKSETSLDPDTDPTPVGTADTEPELSDTFPNPLNVQPIDKLPGSAAQREYGSLLMARFLSYRLGNVRGDSLAKLDLSDGNFRTTVNLDSLVPDLVPGRWLQFKQSSERPESAGYPALISWQDELGFRYLLYVPEESVLWDPLRGELKADTTGRFAGWTGLVRILTRTEIDPQRLYRTGSGGASVERLQELLTETTGETVPTTGRFGPLTESVLRRFQKKHDLTDDGVAGPETNLLLLRESGVQFSWTRSEIESFVSTVRR